MNRIIPGYSGMDKDLLEFAVFCVESVAENRGMGGDAVYRIMVDDVKMPDGSNLLDGYILPFYDSLHTQGKDYIVRELIEVIHERGGKI